MADRNPSTWEQYERGASPGQSGSVSSSPGRNVVFEADGALEDGDHGAYEEFPGLRRRRSSVTMRLTALTDIGGVNSIRSFTRSWQRAAAFAEVIPQRPPFVFAGDQDAQGPSTAGPASSAEAIEYGRSDVEASPPSQRTSLLRQHIEATRAGVSGEGGEPSGSGSGRPEHSAVVEAAGQDFRERERKALDSELARAFYGLGSSPASGTMHSIFAIPPHLATPPIVGSYGSYGGYGTIPSEPPSAHSPVIDPAEPGPLWAQPQETGTGLPDGDLQPILVKEVERDGKIVLAVEGQSTLPQTVFNSTNVLIGVGLLSLPLGFRYAGWICGMVILAGCAGVTSYTALVLAKCQNLDPSLITFSDLAFVSFGRNARIATSILFTLELLAACVALIVLFADSLDLLFPGALTVTEWKVLCALFLIPLNSLPLSLLSYTSIVGILSCFSIVAIILIDGLVKPHAPGSLVEPAATYLFPANWLTLPLSFGLLMSPWGGHSVFPNIYRDMRHPHKYKRAVKITFTFTYLLDAVTAVAGLLMFGDEVRDEITLNILQTTSYPRVLTFLMCAFIGIIPLTKIPLNARPIVTTLEVIFGIHHHVVSDAAVGGRSASFRGAVKLIIRVVTPLVFLFMSILIPDFDSIMAFMGSALCFTICVTLPLAFYLKLFKNEISAKEAAGAYALITLSIILSTVGTIWAFLPRSLIGAA